MNHTRRRRTVAGLIIVMMSILMLLLNPDNYNAEPTIVAQAHPDEGLELTVLSDALQALSQLEVKGRAAKTGYSRSNFGPGWMRYGGCDMRNLILARDMTEVVRDEQCRVVTGMLDDPYTGQRIAFIRGPISSQDVQIDHVVALSDAWQKGARGLTQQQRIDLSNDPLNLLAVEGAANQQKADSDAASWLPPNRPFRCQFVARQIAVKQKYTLWVTSAERDMMARVLERCPGQQLPTPQQPGDTSVINR